MSLDYVVQAAADGSQTVNAAASAAVTWLSPDDVALGLSRTVHSTTTNPTRFTAPLPGAYEIDGQLSITGDAAGFFTVTARVNGSGGVASGRYATVNGNLAYGFRWVLELNAGDYVELLLASTTSNNLIAAGSRLIFKKLTRMNH